MAPSKMLAAGAGGVLSGIVLGSALFSWELLFFIFVGGVAGLVVTAHRRYLVIYVLIFLLALSVGAWRAATAPLPAEERAGELLEPFRAHLVERSREVIGGPEQAMFVAMTLGWRDDLTAQTKELFSRTGIRHILAISGMHLTIVAVLLLQALVWAGLMRTQAFYVALGGILAFILLVGAPPSAVRAGIMAGLYLTAQHVGRLSQSWRLLLVAAAAMVLVRPSLLVFSVGFQLSFLAVLGIILFKPFFDIPLGIIPWEGVRDLMSLSLAAQLTTWPVVLHTFGSVSLVGPLANLLAVPLLPVIMVLGLLFMLVGWSSTVLAKIILYPAWALLHTIVAMVEKLGALPWAAISSGSLALFFFIGYYGLLAAGYWWGRKTYHV